MYGKYIVDKKYKILSESACFCRRCDKNMLGVFTFFKVRSSNCSSLTKLDRYVLQVSVATLFR